MLRAGWRAMLRAGWRAMLRAGWRAMLRAGGQAMLQVCWRAITVSAKRFSLVILSGRGSVSGPVW
jgi:hypothetical protein